jgi:hypothetical protein
VKLRLFFCAALFGLAARARAADTVPFAAPQAPVSCPKIPLSSYSHDEILASAQDLGVDIFGVFTGQLRGVVDPKLEGEKCLRYYISEVEYAPLGGQFLVKAIDVVPGDPEPDCAGSIGTFAMGVRGAEAVIEPAGWSVASLFRKNDIFCLDMRWTLSPSVFGTSRAIFLSEPGGSAPRLVALVDLSAPDAGYRYPDWVVNRLVSLEDADGDGVLDLSVVEVAPPLKGVEDATPWLPRLNYALYGLFDPLQDLFIEPTWGNPFLAARWR